MSPSLKKAIVFIFIYLLIFSAVVFFAFYPAIKNLKRDKLLFAQKQYELNETYTKLNTLQKTEKHSDDFKKTADAVKNYLPDNLDVGQFLVQTDALSKSKNLILENVTINEIKSSKPAPKTETEAGAGEDKNAGSTQPAANKKNEAGTQFTFGFRAPYASVLDFIKGMETLARFNTITSVTLSGTSENSVETKLIGNIYYGK